VQYIISHNHDTSLSALVNKIDEELKSVYAHRLEEMNMCNGDGTKKSIVTLAGQFFEYESPVQIVILARSSYVAKELSLALWNILGNNLTIKYDLPLYDKNDKTVFYRVRDIGSLRLLNVQSMSFSDTTIQYSGVVSMGAEFNVKDKYFIFENWEDIATKYVIL